MAVSEWDLLDQAYAALRSVALALPADALSAPTPCDQWNVGQVLQHAAGDQLAYPGRLTGGPGPAEDPFAPTGTLAAGPAELLEPALAAALSPAARALAEPLRGFAYGPAFVPAPDPDADPAGALLAFLGRRPDWTPSVA
ncbi:maleylpyruvate isomerase N-terminal domain-containing protein [Streptomyces sp. AP-93]|uniref:maleylpyruvate isomerase N-terminal domain-containing protein n=1 Tax=Streptomyces sp. AP-93 TaxID=2929048 RepID=UPI001FB02841|nr:maleylpyruvate isomerase N-terminal domain-containing protein [Streptomyces sp. AP-93]MCJ0871256.1 maleylpyruvate isomerase N-terminal domain-containing protein [Streptomyces sp. AP-93]